MALKKCKFCGGDMSSKAKECIHCGAKKKKTGLILGIVLGTLFFLFAIFVSIFVIEDLAIESELDTEIEELYDLIDTDNFDMDEINIVLNRTIADGEYGIVESAVKNYVSDFLDETLELSNILDDESLSNLLTASNYRTDGPNFIVTKAYIEVSKEKLKEYEEKVNSFYDEDKAMSYIENKKVDKYFKNLYKDYVLSSEDEQYEYKKEITDAIEEVIIMFDDVNNVLDYLKQINGSWSISGDNIYFETDEQVAEYNKLISKIN